jgi:hypothetical protein
MHIIRGIEGSKVFDREIRPELEMLSDQAEQSPNSSFHSAA